MKAERHPILLPHAAFAAIPTPRSMGRGVVASDRDGLGVATVIVRKYRRTELAQRIREGFKVELPHGPKRSGAHDFAICGTGPGAWLATFERGGNASVRLLQEVTGDLASISDQSDGYAVLRLTGPRVRDTLCKLVPIDVHPRAFSVGDVAVTVAAHIGAILWRLKDCADSSPVFEIAVFRSFAGSFWRVLSESAAEFGFEKQESPDSTGTG